jgi:ribosomal protein S12 methylthiotransferase accessory factor
MSEIYPVEELEWENNTVGNRVRPFALRLQDLTQDESADLLETLLDLDLADDLPVTTLIGLCADSGTTWVDLRVGELKTLAALAVGATDDILDGCTWIAQFNELPPARAALYRCIANLVQITKDLENGKVENFTANLALMYGKDTLALALNLVNGDEQYVGLENLGNNMESSKMHQQLLAAYAKVRKQHLR